MFLNRKDEISAVFQDFETNDLEICVEKIAKKWQQTREECRRILEATQVEYVRVQKQLETITAQFEKQSKLNQNLKQQIIEKSQTCQQSEQEMKRYANANVQIENELKQVSKI